MSDFDVDTKIEEFCSHAAIVPDDGENRLGDLIRETRSLGSLLLHLLVTKNIDLLSKFLQKAVKYPTECAVFLKSEELSEVCSNIGSLSRCEKAKTKFVELFLNISSSSVYVDSGIISHATLWIASDSLELSHTSSQLLTQLASVNIDTAKVVLTQIMPILESIRDDSTKFVRYLSVLAGIMKISSEFFLLCAEMGVTPVVTEACQCSDVLLQTVSLDFLVDISSTSAGAKYLDEHRQLHWLVAMTGGQGGSDYLDSTKGQTVDEFLKAQSTCCAAKALKNIEQLAPSLLYDYISDSQPNAVVWTQSSRSCHPLQSVFVSGVLQLLDSTSEADKLSAVESITLYATSSPRAFLLLLSSERLLSSWLDLLRKQPSLQATTLHSIAQVLLYPSVLRHGANSAELSPVQREIYSLPAFSALSASQLTSIVAEMDSLKRKLFGQICIQLGRSKYESSMDYLVRLAKGPIGELKNAAYDVMRALAYQSQTWGVQTLFAHTAFYPFLLDRNTEHSKSGKDWKFSLILALHFSPNIELLVAAIPERIQSLVDEGAYHVPLQVAGPVTMEL